MLTGTGVYRPPGLRSGTLTLVGWGVEPGDEEGLDEGEAGREEGGVANGGLVEDICIVGLRRELLTWLTVESWSWMSIMWSPNLMVRLSGAAPHRKSLT